MGSNKKDLKLLFIIFIEKLTAIWEMKRGKKRPKTKLNLSVIEVLEERGLIAGRKGSK